MTVSRMTPPALARSLVIEEVDQVDTQDNPADLASYNYAHFDQHIAKGGEQEMAAAFRDTFRAGQRAGDFALQRLDDAARVRLSELWRSTPLVMEFGSFT